MDRIVKGLVSAALLAFAACAAPPTPYQEALNDASYGYNSKQLDENTWRVSFRGNSSTDREVVEDYVLYRSAELTLEQGARGFVVLKDDVDKDTSYYGTGYPYGGFGSYGYRRRSSFRSLGFYYGGSSRSYNRYTSLVTIRLYIDTAPEGLGPAYDAKDLVDTLGPRITRSGNLG